MAACVVWDPTGEYWEGALVDEPRAREIRGRGVIALPVEPEALRHNALGGFYARSWGAGWDLPAAHPDRFATMALYLFRDLPAVWWAARLEPTKEFDGRAMGQIRFMADSTQLGLQVPDLSGVERSRADLKGAPDSRGGWTIEGVVHARVTMDGVAGMCLYGAARGIKVVRAAISQTRNRAQ